MLCQIKQIRQNCTEIVLVKDDEMFYTYIHILSLENKIAISSLKVSLLFVCMLPYILGYKTYRDNYTILTVHRIHL
jgi:hypothetical protein